MELTAKLRPLELIVQPQARTILKDIQKCTSFAIIAGGYLRDQYYGVQFKDIDVFTSSDLSISKLEKQFAGWSVDNVLNEGPMDHKYDAVGQEFSIYNLAHPQRPPIQIIMSDNYTSIMSVLGSFDFGFCQIAFDGANVLVTDTFWQDAANNTATFIKDTKTKQYSDHEKRLRVKYQNLRWIDHPPRSVET